MNDENQSISSEKFGYHVENELNDDTSTWDVNDNVSNQNVDHETSIGANRPRRKNAGAGVS